MSAIEKVLEEFPVQVIDGNRYIKVDDVARLFENMARFLKGDDQIGNDEDTTSGNKEIIIRNGKALTAYIVGNEKYLSVDDSAAYVGMTATGLSNRLKQLELEGSKIRHELGIHKRKRFIKISDIEKYFLGERV